MEDRNLQSISYFLLIRLKQLQARILLEDPPKIDAETKLIDDYSKEGQNLQ